VLSSRHRSKPDNFRVLFLAPLLAIMAWLLLSIGGTDSQATFALVSFAIGLTTKTIVDRITSFVEQTVGKSSALSAKLTVKAKDENNLEIPGCLVTLTFDSSYKTGLTPFTFEEVPRSNGAKKNVTVRIQRDKDGKEFREWEEGSTSRERTLALTGDTIITATYNKKRAATTKIPGEEVL
jgi:hypothetical protein